MKRLRAIPLPALLLAIFWLCFQMRFGYRSGEAFTALLLGWWRFLARILPAITLNWSGLGMAALCLVIAWFLIKRFTRSTRRTAVLLGAIPILFAISIGAAGLFTRINDLRTSNEPWVVRRPDPYIITLRQADRKAFEILSDYNYDIREVRRELQNPLKERLWEDIQLIPIGDSSGKTLAIAFLPRRSMGGNGIIIAGTNYSGAFPAEFKETVMTALLSLEGTSQPLETALLNALPETAKQDIQGEEWFDASW